MTEIHGLQSLKDLLSGPVQKKMTDPALNVQGLDWQWNQPQIKLFLIEV